MVAHIHNDWDEWKPFSDVAEKLGGRVLFRPGDRARECLVCGKWQVRWTEDEEPQPIDNAT